MQTADLPIVFLTAKTLKEDILEGFKIGATRDNTSISLSDRTFS